MGGRGIAATVTGKAGRAGNSDALENLARIGLVAYGIVHVLVAWIALQLAWGGTSGRSADQSGAMATLAKEPFGTPLLWVLGAGLVALALWQGAEVFRWRSGWSASGKRRTEAIAKSVKAVAKAVVYVAFALLAIKFAMGSGQSSSQQQQNRTAGVFTLPGGRVIVAVVGLVLIGIGVQHVVRGVKKSFLKQIDLGDAGHQARRVITRLGQVGFPAKGVALGVVGCLLGYAAFTFDPKKAAGLDGALRTIAQAPFGGIVLTLVALGLAAFGAFCFARARYPERT